MFGATPFGKFRAEEAILRVEERDLKKENAPARTEMIAAKRRSKTIRLLIGEDFFVLLHLLGFRIDAVADYGDHSLV